MADAQIAESWEGYLGLTQLQWNIGFAIIATVGTVGQTVDLPIWFTSVPHGESLDPYFILTFAGLWFCIIFGTATLIEICRGAVSLQDLVAFTSKKYFLQYIIVGMGDAFNGILLVFAAARCAAYLQAILTTLNIFWTIVVRYAILNKKPSTKQMIYATFVYVGLFIASVPDIFGLDESGSFSSTGNKVVWPLIFGISFLPAAIMNVVGEKVLKDSEAAADIEARQQYLDLEDSDINSRVNTTSIKNVNIWYFLFMESIFQELTFICCIWVDSLPHFGTQNGVNGTLHQLNKAWRWFFGLDGAPASCTIRAMAFVIFYALAYIGSSFMLRYTEGATWNAVVVAISTPASAIFWLIWDLDPKLELSPHFNNASWCVLVGLAFMAPFIYFYHMEAHAIQLREKERLNPSFDNIGHIDFIPQDELDQDQHQDISQEHSYQTGNLSLQEETPKKNPYPHN